MDSLKFNQDFLQNKTKQISNPQQTKFFVAILMKFTVHYHIKYLNIIF